MKSDVRTTPGPDGMTAVWLGERRIAFVWPFSGDAGPLWAATAPMPLPNAFTTKEEAVAAVAAWGRANPEHVLT